MYWQVYLHKTVICAEQMLIKALKRAKYLSKNNDRFSATPALDMFLYEDFTEQNFIEDENIINNFALLDDSDIYVALKTWQFSEDKVLAYLCSALINRRLFRIELENDIISQKRISDITKQVQEKYQITDAFDLQYFVFMIPPLTLLIN